MNKIICIKVKSIRCRQNRCFGFKNPTDELSEIQLMELRRTTWKGLGEKDRMKMEHQHGNPYYLPSIGSCETFTEYESKCNKLLASIQDDAGADSSEEYAQHMNILKSKLQREFTDKYSSDNRYKHWNAVLDEFNNQEQQSELEGKNPTEFSGDTKNS